MFSQLNSRQEQARVSFKLHFRSIGRINDKLLEIKVQRRTSVQPVLTSLCCRISSLWEITTIISFWLLNSYHLLPVSDKCTKSLAVHTAHCLSEVWTMIQYYSYIYLIFSVKEHLSISQNLNQPMSYWQQLKQARKAETIYHWLTNPLTIRSKNLTLFVEPSPLFCELDFQRIGL